MSLSNRTDRYVIIITIIIFFVPYAILVAVYAPPPTMPNSGVADFEKTLIAVDGILLGFAGIMFAQLLAGGQSQRSVAGLQRNLSILLLRLPVRGAALVVSYFTGSIVISVWILADADTSPNAQTRIADAVVLPLISMVLALVLLLVYMARYSRAQLSLNEAGPQ